MPLPPILSIVGRKNAGKTTLTVRLSAELVRRGVRVMTIKHGHHTFNIDPATTDTYRHFHEGLAERVAMVSPGKFALVRREDAEPGPEAIVERYLSDAHLVLCEGFKRSALPKIEVHRCAVQARPLLGSGEVDDSTIRAVVTDDAALAQLRPSFALDDVAGVADFVQRTIIPA